jgi:hypothetical protein
MSSTADTGLEPKVESADAGPKLAETETKLATEPIQENKAVTSEAGHGEEKKDAAGAAPVCDSCTFHMFQNMRCASFELTDVNTDFDRACQQCSSSSY